MPRLASRCLFALFCLLALPAWPTAAIAAPVPRTILALYDGKTEPQLRFSNVHQMAAMPLNYLGLTVEFHDIRQGLPDVVGRDDLRGVLMWLTSQQVDDPNAVWTWLGDIAARGLRVGILGDLPLRDAAGHVAESGAINRVLTHLGVRMEDRWIADTYGSKVVLSDAHGMAFERALPEILPPFGIFRPSDDLVQTLLVVQGPRGKADESALAVTGRQGGIVSPGYGYYRDPAFLRTRWYINPFTFFSAVFDTDSLPKPDVTTISGRRLFQSHIDGDGWLNESQVPGYATRHVVSAEVILHEIIDRYPDLPVSVAPIVAELDPAWHGSKAAMDLAREIFARPNVEPSSHTYSHPFQWSFFRNYDPASEKAFRTIYNARGQNRYQGADPADKSQEMQAARAAGLHTGYRIPRAYGDKPFDIHQEIGGAIAFLNKLTPPGKPVRLVQWSGDTSPFPLALRLVREAGALNINGGDSRFDAEYPSYSSVAPIGARVGGEIQIYAAGSNENTYTDLWTNRYFGYRYLRQTWINTGTPLRIKPLTLYYHIYSAERLASLNAVKSNLDWIRQQSVAPVSTYNYAAIAEGFFTTRIDQTGPLSWRIANHGAMGTIRFDSKMAQLSPDLAASRGVIGWRHDGGALYVAIDPDQAQPDIVLTATPAAATQPRLHDARWRIHGFACTADGPCRMRVQGYGEGQFAWQVAPASRWRIVLTPPGGTVVRQDAVADAKGRLDYTLPAAATADAMLSLEPQP